MIMLVRRRSRGYAFTSLECDIFDIPLNESGGGLLSSVRPASLSCSFPAMTVMVGLKKLVSAFCSDDTCSKKWAGSICEYTGSARLPLTPRRLIDVVSSLNALSVRSAAETIHNEVGCLVKSSTPSPSSVENMCSSNFPKCARSDRFRS